jgi:hypothetical protein
MLQIWTKNENLKTFSDQSVLLLPLNSKKKKEHGNINFSSL